MSKIYSLKKEVTKKQANLNLRSLKIDLNDSLNKNFNKICKKFYSCKHIEGIDIDSSKLALDINSDLDIFNIELIDVSPSTTLRILLGAIPAKYKKLYVLEEAPYNKIPVYRLKITKKNDCENLISDTIYVIPKIKLGDSYNKQIFVRVAPINTPENKLGKYSKIMSLEYIIGVIKVIEFTYKNNTHNSDLINNVEFSVFKENYTETDVDELLNISFIDTRVPLPKSKLLKLIVETISNAKYYQSALILQEKYKSKSKSDYAKSFETKKNIPQKQLQVMRNTTFLKNFSFVEIDELVDIKKFNLIQKEFFILNESLKLSKYLKNKPELRFRRLGKLKVEGVYYPFKKCICIDINNAHSFMHELGHHIDLSGENELSLQSDFVILAREYIKELENTCNRCNNAETIKYYKKERNYFHTPTEVFARCLEIYLVSIKNVISSFLPDESSFKLEGGYPSMTNSLKNNIEKYFSKLFKDIPNCINTTLTRDELIINEETPIEKIDKKIYSSKTKSNEKCINNLFDLLDEKPYFIENYVKPPKKINSKCKKSEEYVCFKQLKLI